MNTLSITTGATNTGITCKPSCLSSLTISTISAPATLCPSYQDAALCAIVAATNIVNLGGYSDWKCTTNGFPAAVPCLPVWGGLTCIGSGTTVNSIVLSGVGLTGKF